MNKDNKKALTLVELVIAITISVAVMFFIGSFVADSLSEIADSNVEARFQEDFVDFTSMLNNYRNVFLTGSVFIDNTGTGSDLLMLTSLDKDAGIIVGVVNKNTMQIEYSQSDYNKYYDKVIGYRDISASEIIELESNPSEIQNYNFFSDKIYDEMKVVDFQIEFYNNGQILDMHLTVNRDYKNGLEGTSITGVGIDNIKNYNLNF